MTFSIELIPRGWRFGFLKLNGWKGIRLGRLIIAIAVKYKRHKLW